MSNNELKDQELEKAVGGYEGTIPAGGITFEKYNSLTFKLNRYYSAEQNTNDVVWVWGEGMKAKYSVENFIINKNNNTWKSSNTGICGYIDDYQSFYKKYPYMLNIRP